MPTWFALVVRDAADERREVVEVFTRLDEAEGAWDVVVRESPELTNVLHVERVEVAELY